MNEEIHHMYHLSMYKKFNEPPNSICFIHDSKMHLEDEIVLISTDDSNLKTKFEVQNCRLGYGPVRILKQFDSLYIIQILY